MKGVLCLLALIGYVAAEMCNHDSDCQLTSCPAGFRIDCHDVHHARQCTCLPSDSHQCFDDHWCELNMKDDCHKHNKRWHCSSRDNSCRCYCDGSTGSCDDDK